MCALSWELKAGGEKSSGKKGSSSSSSAGAGPSARSGHRMVLYKHKILVFGGFYDSGFETKYFGDLHAFDLEQMAWLPAIVPTSALAPQPRSGFGFFCVRTTRAHTIAARRVLGCWRLSISRSSIVRS